jgi:hypothetical protein
MPHHLAGVAVLSVLSTSAAIAHGPEIPSQYRGLWCDLGNDKYQRCRKADTESYLDVGRKEISGLGEEVPACGVDKLVEIKNGLSHNRHACVAILAASFPPCINRGSQDPALRTRAGFSYLRNEKKAPGVRPLCNHRCPDGMRLRSEPPGSRHKQHGIQKIILTH